jgi:hypothetical protein
MRKLRSVFSAIAVFGFVTLTSGALPYSPPEQARARPRDRTPARVEGVPLDYYGLLRLHEDRVPLEISRGLIGGAENCRWDPRAVNVNPNGSRDKGLCQHNDQFTPPGFDPFDPGQAIDRMADILARNYRVFGDWPRALSAYRHGVSWVKAHGVDEKYVAKILEARHE